MTRPHYMASIDACAAQFGDDEDAHALRKNHSTFSEAVEVANRMNIRRIVLTHFSARYGLPKISRAFERDARVAIAFDLMEIPLFPPGPFPSLLDIGLALEHSFSFERGSRVSDAKDGDSSGEAE